MFHFGSFHYTPDTIILRSTSIDNQKLQSNDKLEKIKRESSHIKL